MQAKQTTTLLLLLVLVASLLHTTQGAEFHWTASGSASFDLLSSLLNFKVKALDGSLVAALTFPGVNDDIYFDAAGSYTVKIASSLSCKSIIIGGAGVSGSQTLNISSNVAISSKLQVAANGALNLVQGAVITGAAAVQVTGSLIVQAGASIQTSGALTIDATANAALTLQGTASVTAASISNSGKIVVDAGASIQTSGALTIDATANAALTLQGTASVTAASISNSGKIVVDAGASIQTSGALTIDSTANAALTLQGTATATAANIANSGKIVVDASASIRTSGALTIGANAALTLQGTATAIAANISNSGKIVVDAGASIQTSGALTIDATANAALTLQGTASVTTASISNSGKIVVAAGAKATLAVAAAAQFVMAASSQFIVEGNVTLSANAYAASDNTSRVIVNGYASVQNNGAVNFGRSSVSGSGTIEAGTVTMNGKLQAGNSPGHLLIRGDLTMDTFAEFYEEVVNVVIPGKDYDRVTVTGKATIKGTLFVDLQNGFLPAIGDRIDFIVYGSFEGGFALKFLTRDGNKLVLNRDYDLSYSGSAARVSFKAGLFSAAPTMSHSHVLFVVIMCMFALVARLL